MRDLGQEMDDREAFKYDDELTERDVEILAIVHEIEELDELIEKLNQAEDEITDSEVLTTDDTLEIAKIDSCRKVLQKRMEGLQKELERLS